MTSIYFLLGRAQKCTQRVGAQHSHCRWGQGTRRCTEREERWKTCSSRAKECHWRFDWVLAQPSELFSISLDLNSITKLTVCWCFEGVMTKSTRPNCTIVHAFLHDHMYSHSDLLFINLLYYLKRRRIERAQKMYYQNILTSFKII